MIFSLVSMSFFLMPSISSVSYLLVSSFLIFMHLSEKHYFFDCWAWHLIFLTMFLLIVILLVQNESYKLKTSSQVKKMIFFLFSALIISFSVDSMVLFYMFFEMSAIVIFVFILALGYQPERMEASMFLLLFTVGSSLPFFILLLFFQENLFLVSFELLNLELAWSSASLTPVLVMLTMGGFLVKFPIYFFHIWLPKAHVEASASGSMVLAGILLKLGSYGLYRMSVFLKSTAFTEMELFLSLFSLIGGSCVSVVCLRLIDLKLIIAYSSVAHMSFLVGCILLGGNLGGFGSLGLSLSHGIVSSAMFFCAGIFYVSSNSRLMVLNSGGMTWSPWFSSMWAVLCILNMGTPPSFNFWSEILMVLSLVSIYWKLMFFVMFPLFACVVYSLLLFLNTQSQKESIHKKSTFYVPRKDMCVVFLHVCWLSVHMLILFFFS